MYPNLKAEQARKGFSNSYVVNRNLKRIIGEEGRKQKVIAERSGMRSDTLSRVLACKRPVYGDEIPALASALNVSIDALFEPVEGKKEAPA